MNSFFSVQFMPLKNQNFVLQWGCGKASYQKVRFRYIFQEIEGVDEEDRVL